jgi:hypothetical protein
MCWVMTKRAVRFTQADVARCIRAAQQCGADQVLILPDGTIKIKLGRDEETHLEDPTESKWADRPAEPPRRRIGDRIGGGADQSEARPRPDNGPRRRTKGGWGFHVKIDDPKVIESYRAAGLEVYEDGEVEELIRGSAMGKRETAALGGFFRARGEPTSVKGAGLQITRRLVIRGYIESHGNDDKHRITPNGEAAWLAIANGK